MTPSFVQHLYLPGGSDPIPITWLETFLPALKLTEPGPNGSTVFREFRGAAVRNDGGIAIFFHESTRSATGGVSGSGMKWKYSSDGGRNWSPSFDLGNLRSGPGIVSVVAADDNYIYVLSETPDNTINVSAIGPEWGPAQTVHQSYVTQYNVPIRAKSLVQPGGLAYFFVPTGLFNDSYTIRMQGGAASRIATTIPVGSHNGEFRLYSVLPPGGFLPFGEIWMMGWRYNVFGRISTYRTRDGGQSWEDLGYAAHATSSDAKEYGLFRNPDGSHTLVWTRAQSQQFGTYQAKVYWNRHDGDGWLFSTEQADLGSDGNEPNLLSPVLRDPTQIDQTTRVGVVGERFATYVQRWRTSSSNRSFRNFIRFFNDDGTPGIQREIGSLDGYSSGEVWSDSGFVNLSGRVALALRDPSTPHPYFLSGNDQGMGNRLIPSVSSSGVSSFHLGIFGSPDRRNEAAFYGVYADSTSGAGDVYISTSIV